MAAQTKSSTTDNMNSGVGIVNSVANIVGLGMNAYQYNQEKKRQQRLDNYNKALNERNYQAQDLANSPSVQYNKMRQAGINPLAQGVSPSVMSPQAGQPVSGQQMPQGVVGSAIQEAGKNITDTILQTEQLGLQKDSLEQQEKQIDYQIQRSNAELLISQYKDGQISSLDELNKQLRDHKTGFQFDGRSLQRETAEVEVQGKKEDNLSKSLSNQINLVELSYFPRVKEQQLEALIRGNQSIKVDYDIKRVHFALEQLSYRANALDHFAETYQLKDLPSSIKRPLYVLFDNDKLREQVLSFLTKRSEKGFERAKQFIDAYNETEGDLGDMAVGYVKDISHFVKECINNLRKTTSPRLHYKAERIVDVKDMK